MKNKDLLIVLNTFGDSPDRCSGYFLYIKRILEHIHINGLSDSVRLVVSSVLNNKNCIDRLKNKFKSVRFFVYDTHIPVQVSCNKTILSCIKEFNEEYNGYLYVSAGVVFPKISSPFIQNFLPTLIQKNNTNQYGIIHIDVNSDNGHYGLGPNFIEHDKTKDFNIGIGNFCHFIVVLIHKDIKDFYGLPITDVHGVGGMESGLSYIPYAIKKKYILLGGYMFHHITANDSLRTDVNNRPDIVPSGLNWGRSIQEFLDDKEGIDAGLGYFEGNSVGITDHCYPTFLISDKTKYDENNFSLDERLKHSVKRRYFTNKNEINYDEIKYKLI